MCSNIKDTTRNERTLCAYPQCTRTVWRGADGVFSMYCGITHRDAMAKRMASEMLCIQCKAKPRYVANGHLLPYCGTWCVNKARSGAQPSPRSTPPPVVERCKLAGCVAPAFVSKDGVQSQWCSKRHLQEALITGKAERCLLCRVAPKALVNGKQSDFCSKRCGEDAMDSAPLILEVPPTQPTFNNVATQFTSQWKHPTGVPKVLRVWKIYGKKATNERFTSYKTAVERRLGKEDGNTKRRWHGTIRACDLGDYPTITEFCQSEDCSLCKIIQSSFEVAQAKSRFNFGRFGSGIYTSATSSKADSYVKSDKHLTPYKCMLLNEVVLGKEMVLTKGDQTLKQAPAGYDSVRGEPGHDLNYDECIVYKNEAIRPLFLIIYK